MNKKYIHTYFHCTPFVNIVLEYIVCPTRSIIILRGKIRARRVKSACEKIDCRSDERAFKCRRQVWCRRIVGERRGKRGTNVLSTGRERARHILSRGIAFFDSRRWALESRRIHSRLKKGERERGEEKGSRKTDRGERLRKQSQSNAIEIAGNSSSRIRSLDKGEREHRGG